MLDNLSEKELDALKEIGNIGAGNAATALYQILGMKIDMTVPRASIIPLQEVPEVLGGPDVLVIGVYLRVLGDASGSILFVMPKDSAFYLVDLLMGKPAGDTQVLGEIEESALKEIGNIISGAYLNALSQFTNISFIPSVPALAFDMAGAILDVILAELGQLGDYALLVETQFLGGGDGGSITGQYFLIPDPDSLGTILEAIGVKSK